MRTSFTLLIFILFIGCKNTNTKKNVDFNELIEKSEEYDHIIGTLTRQDIEEFPYSIWFEKSYQNYLIDNETTSLISQLINDYEITCPNLR